MVVVVAVAVKADDQINAVKKNGMAYAWADSVMKKMTLEEKVAQLFIVNVASQQTESNKRAVKSYINDLKLGGIYFSGGTLAEHVAMNNYVRSLQKVPAFIGFDGEWGLAMRIKTIPSFPKNNVLGCITDNALIYECGREIGRHCREMGINIDFAPVADVNTNPDNPVIGYRSFGENPVNVAEKVLDFSKGLESMGVMSVSKHFPGHGDTSTDSHTSLPLISHTKERLDSVELYPFRYLSSVGIPAIMVGHMEVPAIEPQKGLPSSLSSNVIGILRHHYGFKGLIFTDALAMKGVAGFENVCLRALEAGNDLLLTPVPVKPQLDAVVAKAHKDRHFRKAIENRCRRVLAYKYIYDVHKSSPVSLDGLEQKLVNDEFKTLIEKLYCAAVTAVSDPYGQLPIQRQSQKIALLRFGNLGQSFEKELSGGARVDVIRVNSLAEFNAQKAKLKNYATVVTPLFDKTPEWVKNALKTVPESKLVYIFFMDQKNLKKYKTSNPAKSAMVLAHVDDKYMQEFVARALVGREAVSGRLSMTVPEVASAGDGIDLNIDSAVYEYKPETLGMSSAVLDKIDNVALSGIKEGAYPGCQILVMKDGKPVYNRCFGTHTYENGRIVRYTDIYDIASMTKTSATLLAVMKLYEQKKIKLDERISRYLPWLRGTDKQNITVKSLLYHESGLMPSIAFYKAALDTNSFTAPFIVRKYDAGHTCYIGSHCYVPKDFSYLPQMISAAPSSRYPHRVAENMYASDEFRKAALQMIVDSPLRAKKYSYSCVGFILLKEIVEKVSGLPLDKYLEREFYAPMGLEHTLYNPLDRFGLSQIVPSVQNDFLHRGLVHGYVHDDSAAFFGGVSGNAGLFSNAMDMGKLYQMFLDGGVCDGRRYFSAETCRKFTTEKSAISRRGLGFDRSVAGNNSQSPCSPKTPGNVYGHTGFTGTCVWVDPNNNLIYIFLSNRLYPDAKDNKLAKLKIRSEIQDLIYESLRK